MCDFKAVSVLRPTANIRADFQKCGLYVVIPNIFLYYIICADYIYA